MMVWGGSGAEVNNVAKRNARPIKVLGDAKLSTMEELFYSIRFFWIGYHDK
jgi:hypothetical protein